MKIKKTVTVIMEQEDRQKIIDFDNLINEWIKDLVDAEEYNQLYADLVEIDINLHNFLRDY